MPRGIYERTEKMRWNNSKAHKGIPLSEEHSVKNAIKIFIKR